ncbi:unnamed protein product [Caenorhabditis nigoni]
MSSTPTVIPTTTAAPKDIVTYVDIPSWFNDAFNLFNYVLAILQFFAVAITLIHLITLTRKDLRFNTIYRMMIGICICDLISQVLGFIAFSPFWIRSVKPGQECYVTVTYQDALINKYGVGVLDDTQRSATWLGMFMALYRVLSVMFPMSQKMMGLSRSWVVPLVVVLTVMVNGLVSITAMWNHEIRRQRKDFSCDGTQHILPETEERYLTTVPREKSDLHAKITFIYGIIKALPSLIEPVLAVLLILEIRKASKRRQIIKKSEEKDNTTSFILFITMSSFLLEVPNGFSHFAFSYFENSPLIRTIAYLIMCFAEIFPVINSSSHPIVCFFMSTQYRETAKSLFGFTKNAKVIFVEECKTKTRNTTKTARESF